MRPSGVNDMPNDYAKLRVLVVEDEVLLRLSVMDILEDMGHVGVAAADARQALAHLDGPGSIDVMLADIGLADMTGHELARKARETRPGLAVIFASGRSPAEAMVAGCDPRVRYLAKPYRREDLERVLAAFAPEADTPQEA